jgi:hypothetical protein
LVLCLVISVAVAGCKKQRSAPMALPPGPATADAGPSPEAVQAVATPSPEPVDAGPPALPPAGAECHNVAPQGEPVTNKYLAKAPPKPAGGSIVPGTYILTERVTYGNVPEKERNTTPRKMTLVVSDGSGLQLAIAEQIEGAREDRSSVKIASVGKGRFKAVQTCPACTSECEVEMAYTVSGKNLQLVVNDDARTIVLTFSPVSREGGGEVTTGAGGHQP